MKKLLLATTALVASAGVAAADVTVGGDGRMGLVYDGSDWEFTNRVRVSFTLSGETDTGLAFGGSIRADNAGDGASGVGGNIYIKGEFGTLWMGDVDSADKALVGQLHGVGLTGLGDYNELTYAADGGNANGMFGTVNDLFSGSVNIVYFEWFDDFSSGVFQGTGLNQFGFHYNYETVAPFDSLVSDQALVDNILAIGEVAQDFGLAFNAGVFFADGTGTNAAGLLDADGPLGAFYTDPTDLGTLDFVLPFSLAYTFATAAGIADGTYGDVFDPTSTFNNTLTVWNTLNNDFTSPYGIGIGKFETHDYSVDVDVSMNLAAIPARVLYRYDIEGFSIAASYSQLGDSHAYSVGVAYEMDGFSAALGWGQAKYDEAYRLTVTETATPLWGADAPTLTNVFIDRRLDARTRDLSASLGYDTGEFAVKAIYQDKRLSLQNLGVVDRHRSIGLSGSASFDDVTVSAYAIGKRSRFLGETATSFGLGASYDLGGGASVVGGIARTQDLVPGTPSTTRADFGLSFTF